MSNGIKTINAERFKDTVFFSLTLKRRFGNRVQVRDGQALSEYIRLKAEGESGKPAASLPSVQMDGKCKATVQLVASEAFDKLNEFMNSIKDRLTGDIRGKANKSRIKEGLFTVKAELVQEFEDLLKAASLQLEEEFVPAFLSDYPDAIQRSKTLPVKDGGLGPLFNEKNYPPVDALREAFGFEWQWLALAVPEGLPEGLRAAAKEKLERQLSDAAEEITAALRESFRDLVSHATEKLSVAPGEKPKIFRNTMVTNLTEFIETFSARNVMNDETLADLVNKAKEVLIQQQVTPDKLRNFAAVRDTVRKEFATIQTTLDGMIEEQKGRKFQFEDEAAS